MDAPNCHGVACVQTDSPEQRTGDTDFAASCIVFLFAPFAGALIERWDLRKRFLLLLSGRMYGCCVHSGLSDTYGLVTFHIVVFMSLILGLIDAFELPCSIPLVSYMVDRREDVSNGVALNSVNFNIARMIGPSIEGSSYMLGRASVFLLTDLPILRLFLP